MARVDCDLCHDEIVGEEPEHRVTLQGKLVAVHAACLRREFTGRWTPRNWLGERRGEEEEASR